MVSQEAVLRYWAAQGPGGTQLSEAERRDVLDRIGRAYAAAGVPWPGRVVWVGSPAEFQRLWSEQLPPPPRLGAQVRAAPSRFLLRLLLRIGWLAGHVLAALAVVFAPLALVVALAVLLHRLGWPGGAVMSVAGFVLFCCALGPLWEVAAAVLVHGFRDDGRGPGSWPPPAVDQERYRVIEEVGPGPQAGPTSGWIASRCLVLICEPPRVIRTEPAGAGGEHRLHCESGPAVEWAAGAEPGYYLHGVAIPEQLFRDPTVDLIHREDNSEVRRLVIERMGWPRYIREANLRLVGATADPGNPGHELQLYDLPKGRYEPARLLTMVNGSPDRSGRERQYAELVPAWIDDPVQAAAWQYGCPVDVYRRLARRT
jgi:hypothetical protein